VVLERIPRALAAVIAHLPHAAIALDRDLKVFAFNAVSRTLLGLPSDTVGQSLSAVTATLPTQWRTLVQASLLGQHRTGQQRLDRPDGRPIWLQYSASPWFHDSGAVGGALMLFEDVTEKVLAEQRMRERERWFQAFFNRSPVGLNLCRVDGRWVRSNPAFLDIIGYSAEEADGGLTYWELTPRSYDESEAAQLDQLKETGSYGPYEKEFIRKDGTLVPVRLNGFFIDLDGERYIWSLIEDIRTERDLATRLENERLAAIQTSRLATIGGMAAALAHEVNNPLAIVEGYAFTLPSAIEAGDAQVVDEAIVAIRDGVQRAGHIVLGLRQLARTDDAESADPLDPRARVAESLDLVRGRLRNHGIELRTDLGDTAPVRIHAVVLAQVVVNLVNNAFDAVQHQAKRWISVRTWDEDGQACVSVEDSGSALDDAQRTRLFEPFYTTKPSGQGTGLGLSISRGIVEAVGGTLVLAETAASTHFVLTLPHVGNG
jgi:PAS domain S-box-containing protein